MRYNLSERQRAFLRLLWFTLIGAMAVLSLMPGSSAPIRWIDAMHLSDKVLHALGYVPLAFLPVLHERGRRVALLVAVSLLVGVLIEFGQSLVGGRSFEVSDMVANSAGLAIGLLVGLPFRTAA